MCNLLDWSDEWRDTSRFVMIGFLEAQPVDAATQNLQVSLYYPNMIMIFFTSNILVLAY
jgi:hypothetical protein